MHYRKDQFSNGNGNTLEARANANIELGNRNDFSALDIKRINLLYGCSEVNDGCKLVGHGSANLQTHASPAREFARPRVHLAKTNPTNSPLPTNVCGMLVEL